MANSSLERYGVLIGCENVVFCRVDEDSATGTTYESDIKSAPGVIEIAITPQVTNEQFGADDIAVYESVTGLDALEVSLTIASLGADAKAYLLGSSVDANGVLIDNAEDQAPYVAMGFKAPRSDGSMDYIWLYKGKFAHSEEKFRTKEKSKVNWQNPTLKAVFMPRVSDKALRAVVNSSNTAATSVISGFFSTVYQNSTNPE